MSNHHFPSHEEIVREEQKALRTLGLYRGPVDGIRGSRTIAAEHRWHRAGHRYLKTSNAYHSATAPKTRRDTTPTQPPPSIFASLFSRNPPTITPPPHVAVYDVAAHTVYMPDGTRLEAHSGRGNLRDDPRHVNERNRGATPPDVYDLGLREHPFHGVQALRLKPVGSGDTYGRTGLLAHTYMLGPNGDSNGCVSFKNYQAFLKAYQNGSVHRLVVIGDGSSPVAQVKAKFQQRKHLAFNN